MERRVREDSSLQRYADHDEPARGEHRAAESGLGEYLRALKAHRVIVALVILGSVIAAIAWTSVRPPQYQASARILVSPVTQDDRTFRGVQVVRDSDDPTRTVQTAATLLESNDAATRTARRLQPASSAAQVADDVSVEPLGQSDVLAVRAEAEGAQRAAQIATEYARSALLVRAEAVRRQIGRVLLDLQAQQRSLRPGSPAADELAARIIQLRASRTQGDPTLSFEQSAAPGTVMGASRALILVLSLIAGMALGAAAAVLLELTRTRVRDAEEATALFPLPILARVPNLSGRRRQAAANGSLPVDVYAQQAFQSVYLQLAKERDGGSAVMIASASRGDGKTMAAYYLASTMAFAGERVILMDCDLRSPAIGRGLGMDDNAAISDVDDLERALASDQGLPFAVVSVGPARGSLGTLEILVNRLPQLVREARRRADFVVIDTSPLGEVSDALPLLRDVDDIVIVTRAGHTDRRAYEIMRDLLYRMSAPVRGVVVVGVAPDARSSYFHGGATDARARTRGAKVKSASER